MGKLYEINDQQMNLKQALEWEEEGSPEHEALSREIAKLTGKKVDILEYLAEIMQVQKEELHALNALAEFAHQEHKRRLERARVVENGINRLRELIIAQMKEGNIEKIKLRDMDLNVRERTSWELPDGFDVVGILPTECYEILPPKLNKKAFNVLCKNQAIEGVIEVKKDILTVR